LGNVLFIVGFILTAVTVGEMNSSLYLNKVGFQRGRKAFVSRERNFIGVET
jgi:hypothetical protein